MSEKGGDSQEAVESSKVANNPEPDLSIASNGEQTEHHQDNDCSLEQSFEVISPESKQNSNVINSEGHQVSSDVIDKESTTTQTNDVILNKSRSNSESNENSFQSRLRTNFLAKLQSSSDDKDGSHIPSSIASALSSFSSFTSNFSLNNPPSNGDISASSLTIETASTSAKLSQITETREDIFNRKAALERKNLISLTKLIVKDLISSSLLVSRTIDDCQNATHLNNYFTLIDKVLKHGLKQNLLSNKSASLWNALDSLPKYLKESTLMSESVRSLANTKTSDGKIKAWMRLAMMQKKLPEYFNELLANKNVLLKDIYHDYAFMLNDEAHVFAGLIIGVNVIDCNFFVKDANFDQMDDIIDLSPYLRAANCFDSDQDDTSRKEEPIDESIENLTAVLDQKNYLEEWNRRLNSTISNLRAKISDLEKSNSKLEMELKLSEARIQKLTGEGTDKTLTSGSSVSIADAIKNFMGNSESNLSKQSEPTQATHMVKSKKLEQTFQNEKTDSISEQETPYQAKIDPDGAALALARDNDPIQATENTQSSAVTNDPDIQRQLMEQEKELYRLREHTSILETSYRSALEKIKALERDLDVQTLMNADKETTIQIYEKDIREKKAQVESLRASLNDAKKLNSDMSERLNDATTKLKERVKSVSTLQASLDKWKLENKNVAARLQDKQAAFKSLTIELNKAMQTIEELKKSNEKMSEDLKKERESGQSSSVTVETQNSRIAELTTKLFNLESELKDVKPFKDQTEELTKKCRDYELSLEEIGAQLRESRLEVENLKENSAVYLDSQWMDSKQIRECALCQQSFSVTRRKHHCRLCGNVFCGICSDNKMELASSAKPVRVCDTCHAFLLAKFVKSSS